MNKIIISTLMTIQFILGSDVFSMDNEPNTPTQTSSLILAKNNDIALQMFGLLKKYSDLFRKSSLDCKQNFLNIFKMLNDPNNDCKEFNSNYESILHSLSGTLIKNTVYPAEFCSVFHLILGKEFIKTLSVDKYNEDELFKNLFVLTQEVKNKTPIFIDFLLLDKIAEAQITYNTKMIAYAVRSNEFKISCKNMFFGVLNFNQRVYYFNSRIKCKLELICDDLLTTDTYVCTGALVSENFGEDQKFYYILMSDEGYKLFDGNKNIDYETKNLAIHYIRFEKEMNEINPIQEFQSNTIEDNY